MIYEMRVYEAMPGKMPALNDRFANHTVPLFRKHGMTVVGFWTEVVGTSGRLTYMLGYQDLAHRESAWAAFAEDPDWQKARAESERDGLLVARVHNSILRPTSYSPLQ